MVTPHLKQYLVQKPHFQAVASQHLHGPLSQVKLLVLHLTLQRQSTGLQIIIVWKYPMTPPFGEISHVF